jgi:apolipoprotein N-acyltransferase
VIVLGSLKWDDGIPRNSSYILRNGSVRIIDKVVLVPFGESNPLPDWLGKIVNRIFYDGAVDYQANSDISDYKLGGQSYRNAICYEACSETLYVGKPQNMIVLSNNGWFVPSIEPTEQRLLLQYYSRKYGTTIYHSVNMSPSYMIRNGRVVWSDMGE